MSDEFSPAPPDDPIWNTYYAGGFVEPNELPSKELAAAVAERAHAGEYDYYRADIWGFSGYSDWPTSSWLEVAHNKQTGDYRILWKSGIEETRELPAAMLTDWGRAEDASAALGQFYAQCKEKGRPVLGVCAVERIQEPDGRFRNRPQVFGFDFEGAAGQ